jgi:hypothetical protein
VGGLQCGFSHNYSTSPKPYYQLAPIKGRIGRERIEHKFNERV